jgi:hypothetical protein
MLRLSENSLLHSARRAIRRSPSCNRLLGYFIPLYKTLAVANDTQIVIEGFPRCANTFAVVAFNMSQPTPVRVAHHLHSVAQLRRGVELNVPTLVILREPRSAITSLAIRNGHESVRWAAEEYVDFHRGAWDLRERLVFADFAEVTTDFGSVIRRLNRRCGCEFGEFDHTEANVAKCFELAEQIEKRDAGGEGVRETHVSRPSAERQSHKERLARQFDAPALAPLIEEAQRLYDRLSQLRMAQMGE